MSERNERETLNPFGGVDGLRMELGKDYIVFNPGHTTELLRSADNHKWIENLSTVLIPDHKGSTTPYLVLPVVSVDNPVFAQFPDELLYLLEYIHQELKQIPITTIVQFLRGNGLSSIFLEFGRKIPVHKIRFLAAAALFDRCQTAGLIHEPLNGLADLQNTIATGIASIELIEHAVNA